MAVVAIGQFSIVDILDGSRGPSVLITSNRQTSFTAKDTVLDGSQADIVFAANVSGVTSPSFVWTFLGFTTAPTNSGILNQTITSAQFGAVTSALVTCTVTGLDGVSYKDTSTITRLEVSTAAAGANNTYVDVNGTIKGVSSGVGTAVSNSLIKVGGNNLMSNSGQFESLDDWITNGSTITLDSATRYAGYPTIKVVGSGGLFNRGIMRLKADTEYTVSALVKGSAALGSAYDSILHIQNWNDELPSSQHQEVGLAFDTAVATSWKTIYQTFRTVASASATYCRFYFFPINAGFTLNVAQVKLEEGNKYSGWTPSITETQNSKISFSANLLKSVDTWLLEAPSWAESNVYAANKQALVIDSLGVVNSEQLSLASSTDYTVSFEAWSTVTGATINLDLFPDDLPQYAVTLTTTPTLYTYIFNSASASMSNCRVRFFHPSNTVRVCDVKLELGSKRTPWVAHILDQKWANISGTGKPADNATKNLVYNQATLPATPNEGDAWYVSGTLSGYVTGALYLRKDSAWVQTADSTKSQLAGSGVNVMHPSFCTFEAPTFDKQINYGSGGGSRWSLDTSTFVFGTKSLKLQHASDVNDYIHSPTISLQPNKKWIFSCYVRCSSPSMVFAIFIRGAIEHGVGGLTTSATANTWTRISALVDLSTDPNTSFTCIIDPQSDPALYDMWFDGVMLEAQIGDKTTPSTYQEPPNFLNTFIGSLDATKNVIFRQASAPTGGSYTVGDLWFDTDSNPPAFYNWSGTAWSMVSNAVTNTNQVTDGAKLGETSLWSGVVSRPTSLATLNTTDGTKLTGIAIGATANTGLFANLTGQVTTANSATYFAASSLAEIAGTLDATAFTTTKVVTGTLNPIGKQVLINLGVSLMGDVAAAGGFTTVTVALSRGGVTLLATVPMCTLYSTPGTAQQSTNMSMYVDDSHPTTNTTWTATFTFTRLSGTPTTAGFANFAWISVQANKV